MDMERNIKFTKHPGNCFRCAGWQWVLSDWRLLTFMELFCLFSSLVFPRQLVSVWKSRHNSTLDLDIFEYSIQSSCSGGPLLLLLLLLEHLNHLVSNSCFSDFGQHQQLRLDYNGASSLLFYYSSHCNGGVQLSTDFCTKNHHYQSGNKKKMRKPIPQPLKCNKNNNEFCSRFAE